MRITQIEAILQCFGFDDSLFIETIQEKFSPEELFSEEQLTEWAEENGFKKSEETA